MSLVNSHQDIQAEIIIPSFSEPPTLPSAFFSLCFPIVFWFYCFSAYWVHSVPYIRTFLTSYKRHRKGTLYSLHKGRQDWIQGTISSTAEKCTLLFLFIIRYYTAWSNTDLFTYVYKWKKLHCNFCLNERENNILYQYMTVDNIFVCCCFPSLFLIVVLSSCHCHSHSGCLFISLFLSFCMSVLTFCIMCFTPRRPN